MTNVFVASTSMVIENTIIFLSVYLFFTGWINLWYLYLVIFTSDNRYLMVSDRYESGGKKRIWNNMSMLTIRWWSNVVAWKIYCLENEEVYMTILMFLMFSILNNGKICCDFVEWPAIQGIFLIEFCKTAAI